MGRHNEMMKVTTFTRPETMSGQIFTLKVLGDNVISWLATADLARRALWASHSIKTA